MDNYKLRQIMADKNRARTTQEQEGMARMMDAIRLKRIEATKGNHEDVKNVEGVTQEAHGGVLDY